MGKILMPGNAGGGVMSDDVTASKWQVLQGYRTITTDSNDEVVEGAVQVVDSSQDGYSKTRTSEFGLDTSRNTMYMHLPQRNAFYFRPDGTPHVEIDANALGDALASDIVDTKKATSKNGLAMQGTLPYKGNGGKDNNTSSEMWLYTEISGYVVRFEPGAYYNAGQYKPWVNVPVSLVKQAVNYRPEATLNNTVTCGERGQIPVIDTKVNNYSLNQAKNFGIDGSRGKLFMELGYGNAYYCRDDNTPHVEIDADNLGDAGADSLLEWTSATSRRGVKFSGAIKRWICQSGDVISAVNNEGFAWDDVYAGRGRGIVAKIPNGYYIQGANYVFVPCPNLKSENILENVDINGVRGSVPDYRIGRPVFLNATFNTTYVGGVANKDFPEAKIMRDRSLSHQNYGRYTGGTTISVSAISDLHFNIHNERIGFVLDRGILMTFFRQIKITYQVNLRLYTRGYRRTAGVDVYVGLYAASDRKRVLAAAEKPHHSPDTVGEARDTGTYELVIDTSGINEDVFVALCATPYSDYIGSTVSGDVTFTKIELIN